MPIHISLPAAIAMLVFVAVSVLVGSALAGAGGWRAMADRYPGDRASAPPDESYRFASARTAGGLLGTAAYNSCVTVGLGAGGISLELWAPFRLFHPPIFIPWEAIERLRVVPLARGSATQIRVRDGGSLTLSGRVAAAIADGAARRGVPTGSEF